MSVADEIICDLSERDAELRAVKSRAIEPIVDRWIAAGRPARIEVTESDVAVLSVVYGGTHAEVLSGRLMGRRLMLAPTSGE